MIFRLLGPLAVPGPAGVTEPAAGGRKVRALLARLLLDAGRTVPVDRLVDGLYGDGRAAVRGTGRGGRPGRRGSGRPRGVHTVAPGPTQTAELTAAMAAVPELEGMLIGGQALPWVGQPEDVADPVAFLASEDGRWITGTVIDASGGTYLGPKR
ncbi:SDR family oxidoreductase [Streptomyces narbonensis]|uniref:SDR family oxidoreductase n=1 Tax=Streptomyces narbonensis TaxID=67333 RepID=A0ABV3CEC1_9ACTN